VFEFTSGINKVALNGGGRYDGLAELLGGQPTPAIGFGAGMERIILELKSQGIVPPLEPALKAFVVYFGKTPEFKAAAVHITAQLRQADIKAEMSYGDRSRKAQMKQANASGAAYAIIIGEEELANGAVSVKDLYAEGLDAAAKQVQVKQTDLIQFLREKVS
jgi:histidyl-tRNA synthetase